MEARVRAAVWERRRERRGDPRRSGVRYLDMALHGQAVSDTPDGREAVRGHAPAAGRSEHEERWSAAAAWWSDGASSYARPATEIPASRRAVNPGVTSSGDQGSLAAGKAFRAEP
jgi:hypothetical protein